MLNNYQLNQAPLNSTLVDAGSASVDATAQLLGSIQRTQYLDGAIDYSAGFSGAIEKGVFLSGAASSSLLVAGTIKAKYFLNGGVNGTLTATSTLTRARLLTGAAAVTASMASVALVNAYTSATCKRRITIKSGAKAHDLAHNFNLAMLNTTSLNGVIIGSLNSLQVAGDNRVMELCS